MSWYTEDANLEDQSTRQMYLRQQAGDALAPRQQQMADTIALEEEEEKEKGFFSRALDVVTDTARGVAHGIAGGVDETMNFLEDVTQIGQGDYAKQLAERNPRRRTHFTRDVLKGYVDAPEGMVGQGVAGVSQFIVGWMLPGGAAVKVGKAGMEAARGLQTGAKAMDALEGAGKAGQVAQTIGRATAQGAVADFTVFDPYEARLSTMLNEVPWLEPVVSDYLASNDPSESAWEGRVKNAIEGMALGTTLEGILRSPQMFKAMKRAWAHRRAGRPEMAAETPEAEALKDRAEANAVEGIQAVEDMAAANTRAAVDEAEAAADEARPWSMEEYQDLPEFAREEMRGKTGQQIRQEMKKYRTDDGELTLEGRLQQTRFIERGTPAERRRQRMEAEETAREAARVSRRAARGDAPSPEMTQKESVELEGLARSIEDAETAREKWTRMGSPGPRGGKPKITRKTMEDRIAREDARLEEARARQTEIEETVAARVEVAETRAAEEAAVLEGRRPDQVEDTAEMPVAVAQAVDDVPPEVPLAPEKESRLAELEGMSTKERTNPEYQEMTRLRAEKARLSRDAWEAQPRPAVPEGAPMGRAEPDVAPGPVQIDIPPERFGAFPKEVRDLADMAAANGVRIPEKSLNALARASKTREGALTIKEVEDLDAGVRDYWMDRLVAGEVLSKPAVLRLDDAVKNPEPEAPEGWVFKDEDLLEVDDEFDDFQPGMEGLKEGGDTAESIALEYDAEGLARYEKEMGIVAEDKGFGAMARKAEARKAAQETVRNEGTPSFIDARGATLEQEVKAIADNPDAPLGRFATREMRIEGMVDPHMRGLMVEDEIDHLFGIASETGMMRSPEVDVAFRHTQRKKDFMKAYRTEERVKAFEDSAQAFKKVLSQNLRRFGTGTAQKNKTLRDVAKESIARLQDAARRRHLHEPYSDEMGRGKYAQPRSMSLEDARKDLPPEMRPGSGETYGDDLVAEKRDRAIYQDSPEMQPPIQVAEELQGGSAWVKTAKDKRTDFYARDVESVQDFPGVVARMKEIFANVQRGGGEKGARRSLMNLFETTGWRDEEIIAFQPNVQRQQDAGAMLDAAQAMASSIRDSASFITNPNGKATPADTAYFLNSIIKYDAYLRWVAGKTDEAARILEGAKEPTLMGLRGLGERQWAHRFINEQGRLNTMALAQAVRKADDFGQITRIVTEHRKQNLTGLHKAKATGARFVSKPIREIWVNSVLSSPATHMRNIIGNTMVPLIRIPEHFLASAMEGGLSKARGTVMADMQGMVQGFRDGIFLLNNDFRTAMAEMGGDVDRVAALRRLREARGIDAMHSEFAQKIKADDISNAKATGLPNFMMEKSTRHPWGSKVARLMDTKTRQAINTPLAALQSEDMFFKMLTYRMEVNRRAFLDGWEKGLRGTDLDAHVARMVAKPSDDIHMASMKQSHVSTFTNDLGEVGQWTLDALNAVPGARYVVPFFKTPANIAMMAGRYVPYLEKAPGIGLLYKAEAEAMANGGRAAKEIQARRIVGGGIILSGMGLVFSGQMTGGEIVNPQFKGTRRRLGRPEYSVKIGDTWYDYRRWAGPWGLTLGGTADMMTLLSGADTQEEYDRAAAMFQTFSNIIGGVVDETWMGNVGEFMDVVAGDYKRQAAERFLKSTARGMVPLSAMADDVREALHLAAGTGRRQEHQVSGEYGAGDEELLEHVGEAMRTAWKGMSGSFRWIGEDGRKYPVLDLYGEPETAHEDSTNGFGWMAALSPVAFMEERSDPLSKAIHDLRMPIDRPRRTLRVSGPAETSTTLEMTPDQYQFYARRVGQLFRQIGTQRVSRARFKDYPSDVLRMSEIKTARSDAMQRARRELLVKFPELRLSVQQEKIRLRAEVMGGG